MYFVWLVVVPLAIVIVLIVVRARQVRRVRELRERSRAAVECASVSRGHKDEQA
ncbi:hypothetical protein JOF48_000264 [Arthrobacter stackebrandtii]|uniref:Heme exporter protein D n=1 Tax=Arthrobacter stackebrandtii TaxID=272161 RepID=A0ABS4YS98_9MICC|nr:hypothetical protein [Arthrobacter stackebrandtii]MBP2411465.1 hypothetical protein [Arthrobacter stackebrandtii]